jgi:hypothetical protein
MNESSFPIRVRTIDQRNDHGRESGGISPPRQGKRRTSATLPTITRWQLFDFPPWPDSLQIPQHLAIVSRPARVVGHPPNPDLTHLPKMTHSRTMVPTCQILLGRRPTQSPPPRAFLGPSSVIPSYLPKRTGSRRLIPHGQVTNPNRWHVCRILRD